MEQLSEWYRETVQGKHLSAHQLSRLCALAEREEEGAMGEMGEEGVTGELKGNHHLHLLELSVLYNVLRNGQRFDEEKTERLFLRLVEKLRRSGEQYSCYVVQKCIVQLAIHSTTQGCGSIVAGLVRGLSCRDVPFQTALLEILTKLMAKHSTTGVQRLCYESITAAPPSVLESLMDLPLDDDHTLLHCALLKLIGKLAKFQCRTGKENAYTGAVAVKEEPEGKEIGVDEKVTGKDSKQPSKEASEATERQHSSDTNSSSASESSRTATSRTDSIHSSDKILQNAPSMKGNLEEDYDDSSTSREGDAFKTNWTCFSDIISPNSSLEEHLNEKLEGNSDDPGPSTSVTSPLITSPPVTSHEKLEGNSDDPGPSTSVTSPPAPPRSLLLSERLIQYLLATAWGGTAPLPALRALHALLALAVPYSGTGPSLAVPYSGTGPSLAVPYSGTGPSLAVPYSGTGPSLAVPYSGTGPKLAVPYSGTGPSLAVPYSSTGPSLAVPYSGTGPSLAVPHSGTGPSPLVPAALSVPQAVVQGVSEGALEHLPTLPVHGFAHTLSGAGEESAENAVVLRKVALLVLRSVAVLAKHGPSDVSRGLVSAVRCLDGVMHGRHGSEWLVDVLGEQDDVLIEALLCIHDSHAVLLSTPESLPLPAWCHPHRAFMALMRAAAWDHTVLLDWITAPETCCLIYVHRYLHYLCTHWPEFLDIYQQVPADNAEEADGTSAESAGDLDPSSDLDPSGDLDPSSNDLDPSSDLNTSPDSSHNGQYTREMDTEGKESRVELDSQILQKCERTQDETIHKLIAYSSSEDSDIELPTKHENLSEESKTKSLRQSQIKRRISKSSYEECSAKRQKLDMESNSQKTSSEEDEDSFSEDNERAILEELQNAGGVFSEMMVDRVMTVLIRLRVSIERLVDKRLMVIPAARLLQLLRKCEALYEGNM